jgi:hypothetical protein
MATTLTEMPASFTAGTTVQYTRSHSEFAANAGWSMKIHVAGGGVIHEAATPSGAAFVVTLSATETANLPPGTYQWEERVTKAGEEFVAASGIVEVYKNIAQATEGSFLSKDEQDLVVVEAAITGRLTSDMESYSINGRTVNKIPMRELMTIRAELRRAINARKHPGTLGPRVLSVFKPNE